MHTDETTVDDEVGHDILTGTFSTMAMLRRALGALGALSPLDALFGDEDAAAYGLVDRAALDTVL